MGYPEEGRHASIPSTLHRIVLPPMRSVGRFELYWQGFQRHNPGWNFVTWTDPDPGLWPQVGHLFRLCGSPAQIADLMRFELLWRQGGVYVDTDCESVQSLAPLLDDPNGFFLGRFDNGRLATGVIGSRSGHPAARAYIDAVTDGFDTSAAPNHSTGPYLVTAVLRGRSDVTVHPVGHFYPEPFEARHLFWSERQPASRFSDAYVVHRWEMSWDRPASLFAKVSLQGGRLKGAAIRRISGHGRGG